MWLIETILKTIASCGFYNPEPAWFSWHLSGHSFLVTFVGSSSSSQSPLVEGPLLFSTCTHSLVISSSLVALNRTYTLMILKLNLHPELCSELQTNMFNRQLNIFTSIPDLKLKRSQLSIFSSKPAPHPMFQNAVQGTRMPLAKKLGVILDSSFSLTWHLLPIGKSHQLKPGKLSRF